MRAANQAPARAVGRQSRFPTADPFGSAPLCISGGNVHSRIGALIGVAGATLLAACGGASGGIAPTTSAVTHDVGYPAAAIKQIQIPQYSCCDLAVDAALDHIYVSTGGNLSGNHTTVVDGATFSIVAKVNGFGGAYNVDYKKHNVWLPGLYSGKVEVYSGVSDKKVATVALGACPVSAWVDGKRRYAWVAAQCGSGDDPAWAVNADTDAIVAGPIGTGGVMGPTVLNPITGKFYVNNSSGNFEINPGTFVVSATAFGLVLGVDPITDAVYAQAVNGLNIVDGRSEVIQNTVKLPYTPSILGVNGHLNHVYLSAGQNVIDIREGTAGKLLKTITFAAGTSIVSLGADQRRARIYAGGISGTTGYLYEIDDTY